jgi:hypothetical protein
MAIQWGPTTPLVVAITLVALVVALVVISVATLVVVLEVVITTLEIATSRVTIPGARSVVVKIIWHRSVGISMMMATRWMRSLPQRWPLRHPTPSTQTGTPTQARQIISQVILSVWLCVRSIMARIKSKLPVGQVCLFNMLAILYLCTDLHVIIMSFLNFTHFIFLSRMPPRGSLFFTVDVWVGCSPSPPVMQRCYNQPYSRNVHL